MKKIIVSYRILTTSNRKYGLEQEILKHLSELFMSNDFSLCETFRNYVNTFFDNTFVHSKLTAIELFINFVPHSDFSYFQMVIYGRDGEEAHEEMKIIAGKISEKMFALNLEEIHL